MNTTNFQPGDKVTVNDPTLGPAHYDFREVKYVTASAIKLDDGSEYGHDGYQYPRTFERFARRIEKTTEEHVKAKRMSEKKIKILRLLNDAQDRLNGAGIGKDKIQVDEETLDKAIAALNGILGQ